MKASAIAKIYWRKIKDGDKTYSDVVGETKKAEVKYLAGEEVQSGSITPDQYQQYIGTAYEPVTEPLE